MKLNHSNFRSIINKNFVFENNPLIAVAVSGGPDSMALTYLMNNWVISKHGSIIALIINHNLRDDSNKEAKSIVEELKKNKIKSKVLHVSKTKVVKKSMNEARNNRFLKLTNFCKKNNILHLFLAHHKDDNLETYINRKIGGSDFEGLECIKKNIVFDKINVIRPMLIFSKTQIYNFNLNNNIKFIEDPSNVNLKYTRPILRTFLNNINNNLKNEIIKEFRNILKNVTLYKLMISEILIMLVQRVDNHKIFIDKKKFNNLEIILKEIIIKKIYEFFFKNIRNIRTKKIQLFIKQTGNNKLRTYNLGGMIINNNADNYEFYVKKH